MKPKQSYHFYIVKTVDFPFYKKSYFYLEYRRKKVVYLSGDVEDVCHTIGIQFLRLGLIICSLQF
jgi:hypothetical protein